ncbi:hypothetical protein D9M73_127750 [compost metagenome]
MLGGLANGEERDVIFGQIVKIGGVAIDIAQPQHGIGTVQQEIDWRVGHEIARRHKGEHLQARAVAMDDAIVTLDRHRLVEQRARFLRAEMAVEHHRQVDHRRRVACIRRDPLDRSLPKRGHVAPLKRHGQKPMHALRLGAWVHHRAAGKGDGDGHR